jgi:hypothetical protein
MPKWGAVNLRRHAALAQDGIHLHVWHDGVDVTGRCRWATDEGEGAAELLALNERGKPHLNPAGEIAIVRVTGIALVEGEPFENWGPQWLSGGKRIDADD